MGRTPKNVPARVRERIHDAVLDLNRANTLVCVLIEDPTLLDDLSLTWSELQNLTVTIEALNTNCITLQELALNAQGKIEARYERVFGEDYTPGADREHRT